VTLTPRHGDIALVQFDEICILDGNTVTMEPLASRRRLR
jgi:hypothetical protein